MDKARYDALLEKASAQLALDVSPADDANIKKNLEQLASELLLEWLVGDKRFESLGQQTEYWLSRFYEEIFVHEQPDATRIYERFSLSLPRSVYLVRLLRARRVTQWRQAARLELKTQLERHKKKAEEAKAERQAHIVAFDVSLSPGAADELRVVYDSIASFVSEHERPKPPMARASFGNSRWFGIPAETLLLILDNLQSGDNK